MLCCAVNTIAVNALATHEPGHQQPRLWLSRPEPLQFKHKKGSWWRHQMETFSALLALCGESTEHRWIPLTKASGAWTNAWANNRGAGNLGRYCPHYDVTVILIFLFLLMCTKVSFCLRVATLLDITWSFLCQITTHVDISRVSYVNLSVWPTL